MPSEFIGLQFKDNNLPAGQIRQIQERLESVAGETGMNLLLGSVEWAVSTSIELAQIYPPMPSGENRAPKTRAYMRKNRLQDSWQGQVFAGNQEAVGVITNTAPYASFVVGKYTQVEANRHWNTIEDIVDAVLGLGGEKLRGVSMERLQGVSMEDLAQTLANFIDMGRMDFNPGGLGQQSMTRG